MRQRKGVGLILLLKCPPTWSSSIALSTNNSAMKERENVLTYSLNREK